MKSKIYYIDYKIPDNTASGHIIQKTILRLLCKIEKDKSILITDQKTNRVLYQKTVFDYDQLCELIFNTLDPKYQSEIIEISNEYDPNFHITINSDGPTIISTHDNWPVKTHPFAQAIKKYCTGWILSGLQYKNYN